VTTIGGVPRRLTEGPGEDFHPTVSPDRRSVAFERARGANYDLRLLDQQDGRVRRLTWGRADDAEPTWAPDNRRLAFVSDRDGGLDVFLVDAVTRKVRNLTRKGKATNTTPAWRPASALTTSPGRIMSSFASTSASISCPANGRMRPTNQDSFYKGNATSESMCGGGGDDWMWGFGGNDRMVGDPGRDRLWGGAGDDQIWGDGVGSRGGEDRLWGEAGNDRLISIGDGARDCLWGGRGQDRARLDTGRDNRRCGSSVEVLE
jgi:hypothetical protein